MKIQNKTTLQDSIARQRETLSGRLKQPLQDLSTACSTVWGNRQQLNKALAKGFESLPYAMFLYALDRDAIQISDNVSKTGLIEKDFGRDRSQRPYINKVVPSSDFLLSQAYISLRARRPSLTAVQIVRSANGETLGYVGADFDLRDLPLTSIHYQERNEWQQIKGDPAIRGTVFQQTRSESRLDRHLENVMGVMESLMTDRGVFQTVLHFSSSRATIWTTNDPYRYRLLDVDALIDPDVCLAFPSLSYSEDAVIPADDIRQVLTGISQLRFIDETFYLRNCSINIFNGMVSITFSCDGTHYLPFDEFLQKDTHFWMGTVAPA